MKYPPIFARKRSFYSWGYAFDGGLAGRQMEAFLPLFKLDRDGTCKGAVARKEIQTGNASN